MTEYYPTFQLYQAMRDQLMAILGDADLGYSPGGANPRLGDLCRTIGEVEAAYIQSFKTFELRFSHPNTTPGLADSVSRLQAWFAQLDGELQATVEALSDDDIASRPVDRGGDFKLPPMLQLDVYKEALLIFYGKVSVYLRVMGKTLPEQWQDWLG
jgi:hypothetical protein